MIGVEKNILENNTDGTVKKKEKREKKHRG
jgi:hypothetical protein